MLGGGLLQGIHVENGQYSGGWLTGCTVLCGLALVAGYALQGACWLILKTGGRLQRSARRHARFLGVGLLALIVIVAGVGYGLRLVIGDVGPHPARLAPRRLLPPFGRGEIRRAPLKWRDRWLSSAVPGQGWLRSCRWRQGC
jgi:hypothetical protein